ncbi:MAG: hypothetical protein LBU75_07955 [Desulfovibrio sp.]|nr:hypothetical protein [Desulfovibrio sp.]
MLTYKSTALLSPAVRLALRACLTAGDLCSKTPIRLVRRAKIVSSHILSAPAIRAGKTGAEYKGKGKFEESVPKLEIVPYTAHMEGRSCETKIYYVNIQTSGGYNFCEFIYEERGGEMDATCEDIGCLRCLVVNMNVVSRVSSEEITIEHARRLYRSVGDMGYDPFLLYLVLRGEKPVSRDVFKEMIDRLIC